MLPCNHLLSVVVFSGLQQLRDPTAPAPLQQLPLQGHLGVLTDTLLMGCINQRVLSYLRNQFLLGSEGTRGRKS